MATVNDAEIVVVGGGAIGCAVAFSLAQAGKTDVLVIEKEYAPASVTSGQAAGLVGQVRSTVERIRLAMRSVAVFSELQKDPEAGPGWRQVGSLRIALTEDRVAEFRRLKARCDEAGLEVEFVDPAFAARAWPGMRFEGVKAILWCPSDGYLQPYDLAMAYRAYGRSRGVAFATDTRAEGITLRNGQVEALVTDRGTARCNVVINAAGAHAYHVSRMAGLELPLIPVRHECLITVPGKDIDPSFPVFRIPDAGLYGRPDVNALLLGGWESPALALDPRDYDLAAGPPAVEEDWPVLNGFAESLTPLYPAVRDLGIRQVSAGWPTFTPDGRFVLGPSRRVKGFVMAGGCNAHGVSGSAGIGAHVVEALLERKPSAYVQSLSPDRFTETAWDWETALAGARGVYESYYAIAC